MTDWKRSEIKANQFYARDVAKRAALEAAGGLASDKTLRDEFAMAALVNHRTQLNGGAATPCDIAELAYGLADAMLEARKTPTEDDA